MFKNKREKFYFIIVVILAIVFVGSYVYQQYGDSFLLSQSNSANRIEQINLLQQKKAAKVAIENRFQAMESELQIEGSNAQQMLTIEQDLQKIFAEVQLAGKYQSIKPQEPTLEEDFKIYSITIQQISCSPRELGNLLYRLEQESEVMEVEYCKIDNQLNDTGQLSRGLSMRNLTTDQGLLSVDLEISRLVEYRDDEKRPTRSRRS